MELKGFKAKGGWTVRGICDWNHATELLKLHDSAKWHKNVVIAARMAEQSARPGSVLDLCVAATTRQFVWRRTTEKLFCSSQACKVYGFLA